jgi:hypothetical protein
LCYTKEAHVWRFWVSLSWHISKVLSWHLWVLLSWIFRVILYWLTNIIFYFYCPIFESWGGHFHLFWNSMRTNRRFNCSQNKNKNTFRNKFSLFNYWISYSNKHMVMNIYILRLMVRAQECERHMSFSLWFIWNGSFIEGWIEFGWNLDEKEIWIWVKISKHLHKVWCWCWSV